MAIPSDFPHNLLGAPLIGKSRSVQNLYDVNQNFDGKSLVRQIRDTSTVYFDVSFWVPSYKLPLMALWLETKSKGQFFNITLRTEGGENQYNARWTDMPNEPAESQGGYTYSGTLYAEQVLQGWEGASDDDLNDYWDFLSEEGNNALAITVNENWPDNE